MAALFSAFQLRDVTFKNRVAVSPMSQYRAKDGHANSWHAVHLGRFALGGAGLVYVEATAVEADGRRTHGDLGIWTDAQSEDLKPIARFISQEGSVPGIQLGHAGRKASERRPWHGETPVDESDVSERNEAPWRAIAPSPVPYADGWPEPAQMSEDDIERVIGSFGTAARPRKASRLQDCRSLRGPWLLGSSVLVTYRQSPLRQVGRQPREPPPFCRRSGEIHSCQLARGLPACIPTFGNRLA